MMEYDNVSFIEYHQKKKDMLNNIGRRDGKCCGVSCTSCPISSHNNGMGETCDDLENLNPEIALKIVMEYIPKVDWSTVEVDTKVYVSDDNKHWVPRYFAKYKENKIYAFDGGCTSFTNKYKYGGITSWKYAKLA